MVCTLFVIALLPRISQLARTPRSIAPATPIAMPAFAPALKPDEAGIKDADAVLELVVLDGVGDVVVVVVVVDFEVMLK